MENLSDFMDGVIGILSDVTQCSTKDFSSKTKVEPIFEHNKEDDVWVFIDFCERLEENFSIKINHNERLSILDMDLSELEKFLQEKIA